VGFIMKGMLQDRQLHNCGVSCTAFNTLAPLPQAIVLDVLPGTHTVSTRIY